jgi:hypothetical protein
MGQLNSHIVEYVGEFGTGGGNGDEMNREFNGNLKKIYSKDY